MSEQPAWEFTSCVTPPAEGVSGAYWFIFRGDQLVVRTDGHRAEAPQASEIGALGFAPLRQIYLGYLRQRGAPPTHCYAAEVATEAALPDGLSADGLRQLYPQLGEAMWGLAGRAIQIVSWDRTHRYCGQCGALTESLPTERAKRCSQCGLMSYPRLSPAIIIAVTRATEQGRRLLMARNHRFPAGRFSVVAGYVEPGETLEECAQREVLEETGIRIKEIRYFGSQPWPFPNSLMIGFTAEYAGGDFILEEAEIAEAGWFAADALPGLPPKMSIGRRLIDAFVEQAVAVG